VVYKSQHLANDHLCIIKQQENITKHQINMNSKFNALVIACIMMSATAFADSPVASLSVVPASTASVYNVCYKTAEAGKVKVSIYNSSNQLIFAEVLNNVASFMRPYNFSQLAQGEYTIVLEDKNGKQVEKVNYAMNKINSFIKVIEVAHDENKYVLNVANNGTESVYVKIYNDANILLHAQTLEVTGNFALLYNLSKVKLTSDTAITFEISTSSGAVKTMTF
jgi:hypothetical protein